MNTQAETLIFVPTYNESGNVENLYYEIKKINHLVDILFLDDNSPDGTGKIIDRLKNQDAHVHTIHRSGKLGLGTAHIEAFKFARQKNYRYLVTMDADFTHHPRYIPALLAKKEQANIIIGSRYTTGGRMRGWGTIRLPFTHFWRGMIKYGLGMPYDCTGAFRLYTVAILKPDIYDQLRSVGFSFCMESLYQLKKRGFSISEVPIEACNRISGQSKLSSKIMTEVARMYVILLFDRVGSLMSSRSYTVKK